MRHTTATGFVSDWQMALIRIGTQVDPLLTELLNEAGLSQAPGADRI